MQGSEDLRKYLNVLNEAYVEQIDEKGLGKKISLGAKGIFGGAGTSAKAFGELKTIRQAEELYKDWMHIVGRADGKLSNDSDSISRFLSKYANLDNKAISDVFVNVGLADPITKGQDVESKKEVEKVAKAVGIFKGKGRVPEVQSVANLWDQFKDAKEAGRGEEAGTIAKELVNFAADHGEGIEDIVKGLFRDEHMGHWISRIERAKAKVGEGFSERFSFLRMLLEADAELSDKDIQKVMTSVAQLMATGEIYSDALDGQLNQLTAGRKKGIEGPPDDGIATRVEMNQFMRRYIDDDMKILEIAEGLRVSHWKDVAVKTGDLQIIVWAWIQSYKSGEANEGY